MFSVLVIEDDDLLHEGLVASFAMDGYHATGESDGKKALAAMNASPPFGHILSMDGLSLLKEVRSSPQLADVPFVVISVHQSSSFEKTCHLARADKVYGRPFDVGDSLAGAGHLRMHHRSFDSWTVAAAAGDL